jgi:hypothetical protein
VGKPNERERDLIIMLQESTKQQQNHISSQGKYLTAPKLSHRNLPRFLCQNRTAVRPFLPCFPCPQSAVRTVPYGPKTTNRKLKSTSKSVPKIASISLPNLYGCTDCMDPYSTASHSRKIFQPKILRKRKKKKFSRNMPTFLEKRALFAAHFPLSSMLRKSL